MEARQAVEVKPRVDSDLVDTCINAIRILVVDSVNAAQAGHPGAAMGLAPLGYVLFDEAMRYNPRNPHWFNRDRFVLSAGHAVLLQYIDDLKKLTKLGSKTPGHPENMVTPGIEVVTGPLGQGFVNSVGLALAERHLAARFNKPDAAVVDHYTYCIMGDGCVMEGLTNEAASLAGHWGLGKLIVFYDDNHNTIDGSTSLALSEDTAARYTALGWHVQRVGIERYGDPTVLRDAVSRAKAVTDRPSFIQVETTIGFGSPSKQGTSKAHHGAFGEEEAGKIRETLRWQNPTPFDLPQEVYGEMRKATERGKKAEEEWNHQVADYRQKYPEDAAEFDKCLARELPSGWEDVLPIWKSDDKPDATRGYSEVVLNKLAGVLPGMIGGSADLASSNKVYLNDNSDFSRETPGGRNVHFGVREHAMGAISHAGVLYIMTHDSIGLGEDGPTHQPVEHLISLRAIPNLNVFRPGDGNEVSGAYKSAISRRDGPTLLALSRQKLEAQLEGSSIEGTLKGGYILTDNSGEADPELILIGTGAELLLCQKAARELRADGKKVRVVSLVSWELFEAQPQDYKEEVLPPHVTARLAVEAGSPLGWREYVGPKGQVLGVNRFGMSAAYLDVFHAFGFTVENIIDMAHDVLATQ
eukprot:jgi/Mesen1/8894/ME000535S08198